MNTVSTARLYALRAMYLLVVLGLGSVLWPGIVTPHQPWELMRGTVNCMLAAFSLLCLLGLRYPLQMLPLLIFELLWKVIWIVAFALPMWAGPGLDAYAAETLFACAIGVVLVPLVLPWGYLFRHYVQAPAAPWNSGVSVARL